MNCANGYCRVCGDSLLKTHLGLFCNRCQAPPMTPLLSREPEKSTRSRHKKERRTMPLTENSRPCWVPTCDTCGDGDNSEYGGSFHYDSRGQAVEAVEGVDWTVHDDGRLECFGCREERESREAMAADA
jgi:hypothetical protein